MKELLLEILVLIKERLEGKRTPVANPNKKPIAKERSPNSRHTSSPKWLKKLIDSCNNERREITEETFFSLAFNVFKNTDPEYLKGLLMNSNGENGNLKRVGDIIFLKEEKDEKPADVKKETPRILKLSQFPELEYYEFITQVNSLGYMVKVKFKDEENEWNESGLLLKEESNFSKSNVKIVLVRSTSWAKRGRIEFCMPKWMYKEYVKVYPVRQPMDDHKFDQFLVTDKEGFLTLDPSDAERLECVSFEEIKKLLKYYKKSKKPGMTLGQILYPDFERTMSALGRTVSDISENGNGVHEKEKREKVLSEATVKNQEEEETKEDELEPVEEVQHEEPEEEKGKPKEENWREKEIELFGEKLKVSGRNSTRDREIFTRHKSGEKTGDIAKKFGLASTTISVLIRKVSEENEIPTEKDVLEERDKKILERFEDNNETAKEIAKDYNLATNSIYQIVAKERKKRDNK